jgi:hypothetical protein
VSESDTWANQHQSRHHSSVGARGSSMTGTPGSALEWIANLTRHRWRHEPLPGGRQSCARNGHTPSDHFRS